MATEGVGALLLTTEPDVRYFTGFQTPFWLSPTRPWFLVLPAAGEPIAVFPSIGESLIVESWLSDVRFWESPRPADDGITELREVLLEVTGGTAPIGLPMGPESHLRMPLADFEVLRGRLAGCPIVDATPIMRSVRMIKSDLEIAKIRHVCSLVSEAFALIPDRLEVGMSEEEAFRSFRIALLECGVDTVPYLVGATGPGFAGIIGPPSSRRIERGDLLMFDTGATWDGYWSDFDRYYAFGDAPAGARAAYAAVWEATELALDMIRPGVRACDVWQAMAEALDGHGSAGGVGRMGHGLGMQLTEWPSFTAADDTVLGEGMVLTVEPGVMWTPGRIMVHEEDLVVTADGAELLSVRAPESLPVIG